MTELAYAAGMAAFNLSIAEEEAKNIGKVWRAGGRATKAYPNKEDGTFWKAEGPNMVHNYYNWRKQNPQFQIWHTPQGVPAIELEANISLEDGTILKAHIDRVFQDDQGNTIIVDLKTGKPPTSGLQLAVYRLALENTFGFSPKWGAYWMGREGTLTSVFDLDQYPISMVSRWLRDARKIIEAGIFIPNTTAFCNSCGVKDACYTKNLNTPYRPNFLSDIHLTEGK